MVVVKGGAGQLDAVIVGAGLSGIYMLYRLVERGMTVKVLEAASSVGGTWHWNRYPGARCDIPSVDYSYSFSDQLQQEWTWSEHYASQGEILSYLDHVVDRFGLRPHIELETSVVALTYLEDANLWEVATADGERLRARYAIMATGCLSVPTVPEIPGRERYRGERLHTGRWPAGARGEDFAGQRVAVIGTGSSGVGLIPALAGTVDQLTVLQRTPNFVIPARNGPLDSETLREVKRTYAQRRREARRSKRGYPLPEETAEFQSRSALEVSAAERDHAYEIAWRVGGPPFVSTFSDIMTDLEANETAASFVRRKIHETVQDPQVAELLTPTDHPIGTKRICVGEGYYETFNKENVQLVDARASPLEELTPTGIRTSTGHHEFDCIVFATGFDAMTGALTRIDIRGRDGRLLRDEWREGPQAHLGLCAAGFPNLLMITGPGSPSVLCQMVAAAEQHVERIAECIDHLEAHGLDWIEATEVAQRSWADYVDEVAEQTLYPRADSWYLGANVPGKPRRFMPFAGGLVTYDARFEEVVEEGYRGFVVGGARYR